MQVSSAEKQRQDSRDCMFRTEAELAQKTKSNQGGENIHQNICAVADHDAANRGIVAVVASENRQAFYISADNVCRQHEQRLTHAVPALQFSSAAMEAEFGIFLREDGRLGGPERMRDLQAMHGIRRAKF